MRGGLLAEFASVEALAAAAARARGAGLRRLDAFTPFPAHAVEQALGLPRSRLAAGVLAAALAGGAGAYALQWWMNARDYPLDVGGRPAHAPLAFLLISFEMAVLFGALTAVGLALAWAGLPRPWHPLFEVEGFERASVDRFFLAVDARDPRFDRPALAALLGGAGALRVVGFGEVAP